MQPLKQNNSCDEFKTCSSLQFKMKSWSNWENLTKENVSKIPKSAKGVYAIRKTKTLETKLPTLFTLVYLELANKVLESV